MPQKYFQTIAFSLFASPQHPSFPSAFSHTFSQPEYILFPYRAQVRQAHNGQINAQSTANNYAHFQQYPLVFSPRDVDTQPSSVSFARQLGPRLHRTLIGACTGIQGLGLHSGSACEISKHPFGHEEVTQARGSGFPRYSDPFAFFLSKIP